MNERPAGVHAGGISERDSAAEAIRLSDVRFAWPGERFALSIDHFAIARDRHVLLTGPSGSGKSTLLSLIAGIGTPQQGQVQVLGYDLAAMPGAKRDRFRAEHMGIIFQMFNLLPYGSVIDNVLLPLSFAPQRRARVAQRQGPVAEARHLLSALSLDEALHGARSAELSVGQQQRVAAARALIGAPEIIIADEPTSALDRTRHDEFLELLFAQCTAAGTTLIMVSHDEALASRFADVRALDDIAATETR